MQWILTTEELSGVKELANQQIPECTASVPKDNQTELSSLSDLSSSVPCDESCNISSKGDCIKRMPGEGQEDSSDSEDSTSSLVCRLDHSN